MFSDESHEDIRQNSGTECISGKAYKAGSRTYCILRYKIQGLHCHKGHRTIDAEADKYKAEIYKGLCDCRHSCRIGRNQACNIARLLIKDGTKQHSTHKYYIRRRTTSLEEL